MVSKKKTGCLCCNTYSGIAMMFDASGQKGDDQNAVSDSKVGAKVVQLSETANLTAIKINRRSLLSAMESTEARLALSDDLKREPKHGSLSQHLGRGSSRIGTHKRI